MSSSIVTPVPDGLLSHTDTPYSKLVCCSKVCRYKISESPSQCSSYGNIVYTDAAVLYSDRIVLNGPDLNEISCYLQKQPGEQEEAALARRRRRRTDHRLYLLLNIK